MRLQNLIIKEKKLTLPGKLSIRVSQFPTALQQE